MVQWTNIELAKDYHWPTSEIKLLKFIGIVLFILKLLPMLRKELWSTRMKTKYSVAPSLGRTGITQD